MDLPHKVPAKQVEQTIMKEINIKKAPGFDLISGKILQEPSEESIKVITFIFNRILYINHLTSSPKHPDSQHTGKIQKMSLSTGLEAYYL